MVFDGEDRAPASGHTREAEPSVRIIATIEARMGSTRLPGKVMADLAGRPMLERLVERVLPAKSVDQVVVATTKLKEDDVIEELAGRLGLGCYRGSVDDVLGRILDAAQAFDAEELVALTGDNPLVDPDLIDDVVKFYRTGGFDYATTTHMHHTRNWKAERTFPVGVSVQIFPVRILAEATRGADPTDRKHVSFVIYDHPERYRLGAFEAVGKYESWRHPELRLTVDTSGDLALMRAIFNALSPRDQRFSTGEAIRLVAGNPRLRDLNSHVRQRIAYQEKEQARTHG